MAKIMEIKPAGGGYVCIVDSKVHICPEGAKDLAEYVRDAAVPSSRELLWQAPTDRYLKKLALETIAPYECTESLLDKIYSALRESMRK